MKNENATGASQKKKVWDKLSFWKLFFYNGATLAGAIGLIWLILPESVWNVQIHSTWRKHWILLVGFIAMNGFVEYGFHRYMLHVPMIRGFGWLFKKHHETHHGKTWIKPRMKNNQKIWGSHYPIVEPSQYEASFFPYYSFAAFLLLPVSIIIVVFQCLLPTWPVAIMLVVSVLQSLLTYEILHWAQHRPDKYWNYFFNIAGLVGLRWFAVGFFNFHAIHHAHIRCNEGISGFFGIPLPDLLFGTFKTNCSEPYFEGKTVVPEDLVVPQPRFALQRKLDAFGEKREERFYRIERFKQLIEIRAKRRTQLKLSIGFAT